MAYSNSNTKVVPEAREGYNGDLSSRDAGRIGGQMVRKLIQQAENQMK